jgi:diacylglycerol kinase
VKAFFKSFSYAVKGILAAVKEQRNLKIHLVVAVLVIALGFYFQITNIEWCILLLTIGLVIGLELINTAIENLVDLVTSERKPLAGKIKDIAAGAVLVAAVIAVVIGVVVFKEYLFSSSSDHWMCAWPAGSGLTTGC